MTKILFFIENLSGGGAEKVLRTLVNGMDQSRFAITVETLWPEDKDKYLKAGIGYKSVYPKRNGFYSFLYRAEAALGLTYALHLKGDYDIECAYLECGSTKIMAGSTNKKAKKLCWVHCNLERILGNEPKLREKSAAWYKKFDKVICVCENVRKSYLTLFGNDPEAVVLYNTVDDGDIRKKAALPLPQTVQKKRLTAVTVGRLNKEKRFDRLLRAHKRLLLEGIEHDLWILGEGSERASLEAYIAENGLAGSVFLLGFQENPYPFMAAADVLVCSSDYEGFSTSLTEGLILGKPIVTTDCGGMDELLGGSACGLITPCSDEGFTEGLRRLLSSPALRQACGEKALQRGGSFTAAALTAKTEDYFEKIVRQETKS